MQYSKTHCHFCNLKLELSIGSYTCPNAKCNISYRYSVNDERIFFMVDSYWFQIHPDNSMIIIDPWHHFKYNGLLEINRDNYLEQVERIKKLQPFS